MVNYQGDELAYYKALANSLKDGIIDQDEYSLLISLRESFGVTDALHQQMENEIRASSEPVAPSDGPGMSTFAGQTTDSTVENYAKMMIDSINRGDIENAAEVWGKSKEIDIDTTNRIFEGEKYGVMIADAYLDHVENNSIPSMLAWRVKREQAEYGSLAYAQQVDREMSESCACIENSKIFYSNYIRCYQIKGLAEYEYSKDFKEPHFTKHMDLAREALTKALRMDPGDEYSLNML